MTAPSTAELAGIPLLQALTPAELERAAPLFTVERYPRGAILIREGARMVRTSAFACTTRRPTA